MKKSKLKKKKQNEPVVTPGNADEYLDREASQKEKQKGEYTRVTRLSWDEVEE